MTPKDDDPVPNLNRFLKSWADDLEDRNKKRSSNASFSDLLSDFTDPLKKAFSNLDTVPAGEMKHVADFFINAGGFQSKTDEVIAVGSVVVAYRLRLHNLLPAQREKVRSQITAIVTANPNVDLKPLENSLGISVISVQRASPNSPPPPGPKGSDW